jgi:hypothetical protein
MTTYDPTHLTRHERYALDVELLGRLIIAGGTSTIRALFDGFRPPWAIAAADRLEDAGLVELLPDRRTAVTAAGRAEFAEHQREQERLARFRIDQHDTLTLAG